LLPITAANPWIESAHNAARKPSAWLFLALASAVTVTTVYILPPPVSDFLPILDGDSLLALTINRGALYLLLFASFYATCLIGVFWERRPARKGAWPMRPASLLGLAIGAGCLGATLAATCVTGAARVAPGSSNPDLSATLGVLLAGVLVLLQCWAEEALFRGWLQPVLCDRWGARSGLIVTAVLFGLAHSIHTPSVLAILNATLAGFLFGFLALRTGGLAAPIAAHFGYNWAEQSIFGLTPNPGVDAMGSIFNFDLSGPAIFSGGPDELNGSICLSLVLGLAVAALALAGAPRREGVMEQGV
jgi:membrane protease YdiL (CAAX protease family)